MLRPIKEEEARRILTMPRAIELMGRAFLTSAK
jgi:hypothetical protein